MHSYHHRARVLALLVVVIGLIPLGGGCDSQSAITGTTDPDRDVLPATVVIDGNNEFDLVATPGNDATTWKFTLRPRGSSGNDNLLFEWDFGDGAIEVGDSLSHSFNDPGFYTVTVTALDSKDNVVFVLTLDVEIPDSIALASALVADAGPDTSVNSNSLVFLDGSQSLDQSGMPLEYAWTQIAGANILLTNSDQAIASFISPILSNADQLVFSLLVFSGDLSAEDTVVVTVLADGDAAVPQCEFAVALDSGSNPVDDIEGTRPLDLVCTASRVGGGSLSSGTLTWSFGGSNDTGDVGTHSVRTPGFSTAGIHTIALALTVNGITVGCQSTRNGGLQEIVTVWPTIEGNVVSSSGGGVSGVAVIASLGGTTSVTDTNGAFSVHVPYNWSGSVAPQHIAYTFSPSGSVLSGVKSDLAAQQFMATVLPPTTTCTSDSDCDDGVFCNGAELCQAGSCLASPPPCSGQPCNEAAGTCGGCLVDSDCDDGLFCNGAERCLAGTCANGVAPCSGQTCVEATDSCASCLSDADCDDSNACTDDSCDLSGQCINAANNGNSCDDGAFCNGTESCSSGVCISSGDPCGGQSCAEATDTCVSGLLVSGRVLLHDSSPASGVTVVFSGTGSSSGSDFTTDTNGSGDFQQIMPDGWSGTLTSDLNSRFSPASRTLSNIGASASNQDFSAFQNFYVSTTGSDANPGTFLAPYRSPQRAANVVQPGDTVFIMAGTYDAADLPNGSKEKTPVLKVVGNGTPSLPIRFEGYANDTAILDGRYINKFTTLVTGDYVELRKLTFFRAKRQGVVMSGVTGGLISECIAHSNSRRSQYDAGIRLVGSCRECVIERCEVFNNGLGIEFRETPTISEWRGYPLGSIPNGAVAPQDCTVRDCLVYDNSTYPENSDGMQDRYGTRNRWINNISYRNGDDGFDSLATIDNVIQGNIVFNNDPVNDPDGDGNGIKVGTRGGGGNLVVQNISFFNRSRGYDNDDGQNDQYFHNVAYASGFRGFHIEFFAPQPNILHNNISVNSANKDARIYPGGVGNYNFWADGNFDPAEGANSLSGNPRFVDPTFGGANVPDTSFPAGWTIDQKLDYIRNQVWAAFSLQPNSSAIDAGLDTGLTLPAIDDPATSNTGAGNTNYYDIGAREFGTP